MHQPYYKNPQTGRFQMPWTFLHLIKDYYDMPWIASKYDIKLTFNLVPSLLQQIEEYKNPDNCEFLYLWKKDPTLLTPQEKSLLLRYLFSSHVDNMIKPLDRYYQLFLKKHRVREGELPKIFDEQELLDLEVLFLLSWSGNYLKQNSHVVKSLIEKKKNYTQEDKLYLLEELIQLTDKVVDIYCSLQDEGKIELTTSPFYHPILPLLLDINSARESKSDIVLPSIKNSYVEFAKEHLSKAVDYHNSIFGKDPKGVWSSEGSLSRDAVQLFRENGFIWTATDEEVLYNSLSIKNLSFIYKVWEFNGVKIFFRDRYLSDAIGFRYFLEEEDKAVEDFLVRLRSIYDRSDVSPVVSVILDGENAWEHYRNNGYNFLNLLYRKVQDTPWIETLTFSQVLEKDAEISHLADLKAGSWIMGNFTTWVGHQEKNTAWEYLDKTTSLYRKNPNEKAHHYLMVSQGSDWFWWYGDDHYTHFADVFDNLFRLNLKQVYISLNREPPSYLNRPIKKRVKSQYIYKPTSYITPTIDGRITNYYEWLHGGELDVWFDLSSMSVASSIFRRVMYGYSRENLYLYIEGKFKSGDRVRVDLISKVEITLELPLVHGLSKVKVNGGEVLSSFDKGLEVCIPLSLVDGKDMVEFSLVYLSGERVVERVPVYTNFEITVENLDYNWYV